MLQDRIITNYREDLYNMKKDKDRNQITQLELIRDLVEEEINNRKLIKKNMSINDKVKLKDKQLKVKKKVKKSLLNTAKNKKKISKAKKYAERWRKWRSLKAEIDLSD